MNWKKIIIFLFFFLISPQIVQATSEQISDQSIINEQINQLKLDKVSVYWENLISEYGGYFPESQKGSLLEFISGEKVFSLTDWINGLLEFLFYEFIENGKLLGTLVLLTVLSAVLQTLQTAFEKSSVSKVADAIIFMVLIVIALNSFYLVMEYTKDTISVMVDFIMALLPILLALIATGGGVVSVNFFHPLVIFLMNTSVVLMKSFVLPLLLLSMLLQIVSAMNDQFKATKLANLLRTVAVGSLGIFLTIFLGVISVQGTATAITDGIAVKTAKFVTGNFIPVVGKLFTEAADTVLGASLILKNTVGIAGVVILLLIVVFPALKILSIAIIYRLAAAILQPIGGGPIIKCLDIIGNCVIYVFATLAIVSLMFFFTLTILIASGNITMMMR